MLRTPNQVNGKHFDDFQGLIRLVFKLL